MTRRLAALLTAAILLLAPAAPAAAQLGGGGGSPFAPQAPAPEPTLPSNPADDGLPGWAEPVIIAAGVLVVLGIAFFITRDARRAAGGQRERVPDRRAAGGRVAGDPEAASRKATRPPRTRAKARARGKAQRDARRRNR